nr:MAG TPA: Transcriptional regulator, AbrB family binding protein, TRANSCRIPTION REGULATOR [Caudoviricetes sp.]
MESILGNTRRADIAFYASGRIDITAHVARHLQLQKGDVLDICTDGREYYLYVRHRVPTVGRHEAAVYPTNRNGNNFRAWSQKLCKAVINVSGSKDDKAVRLCVGEAVQNQDRILLPIIIKHLL